ncbi:MAG: hypothetical protein WC533_03015 [Candidatus Pacearchaeota archaeon]
MDNKGSIEKFLMDVYGYGRVNDFIHGGKKDKGDSLRKHLSGTMIGTFRERVLNPKDSGPTFIKLRWPGISTIRNTEDYQAHYKDESLPYHIHNRNLFGDHSQQDVCTFFYSKVLPLFENPKFHLKLGRTRSHMWTLYLESERFLISIDGSNPASSKGVFVDFDADENFVTNLRDIVNKYYRVKDSVCKC